MHKQSGQILLIVVLVIIVASTIGLSISTRSIIGLRTSTEEAESQKALSAAETGIERAIQGNVPVELALQTVNNSGVGINSTYSTEFDTIGTSEFLINGGNIIPKNEGADVWFIKHNNSDNSLDYSASSYCSAPSDCPTSPKFLNLYWGSSQDGCSNAAVQAIIVTRAQASPNEIKSYRYTYDGCSTRKSANNFGDADTGSYGVAGSTFTHRTPQNDLAKDVGDIVFMRVIPIYKDAKIAVWACNHGGENCTELPAQGYRITSTGTSGQATRKLTVFKGWPQTYLPYLSYGLFVAAD